MTLNFKFEKERVMRETKLRLEALSKAQSLSSSMREAAVKVGIVSVFRYSAGLVPWTPTELDVLTQNWVAGFKAAWSLSKVDSAFQAEPTPWWSRLSKHARGLGHGNHEPNIVMP